MDVQSINDSCELCRRSGVQLTFHHLVPKKMHGKKYVEKEHPGKDLNTYGINICKPCHKMIHLKIDHRELALNYFTKDLLLQHPEIQKFVAYQARQK